MKLGELQTGTRFEFEFWDNTGEKAGITYVSQLLEPAMDMDMVISTPISEARLVFVPLNGKVRLTFFHRKYSLLSFVAVVEAKESRGNISILKVKALSQPEKIQRRKHYRLDCLLGSELRIMTGLPDNAPGTGSVKASVKNISGSGASVVTDANIPAKAILELFVSLSPSTVVRALSIVMRSKTVEVKKSVSYELGLNFTEISPKDQDLIIKYVFEQQRVLLKKDILEK